MPKPIQLIKEAGLLTVAVNSRREYREIELLLLSQQIVHWAEHDIRGRRFIIADDDAALAEKAIAAYIAENRNWPPPEKAPYSPTYFDFSPIHIFLLLALFYFHAKINESNATWWLERGSVSAEKVLAGEFFRCVTALTLHLDAPHLFGNLTALLLFSSMVAHSHGWGFSWLLIVVGGTAGNCVNALFYQSAHNAVGASTSVFAAVGLMGAFAFGRYRKVRYRKKKAFVPIVGVLGIFAMLGTNPATDVLAHFFGLVCGFLIGATLTPVSDFKFMTYRSFQLSCFVLLVTILLGSWCMQLSPVDANFLY